MCMMMISPSLKWPICRPKFHRKLSFLDSILPSVICCRPPPPPILVVVHMGDTKYSRLLHHSREGLAMETVRSMKETLCSLMDHSISAHEIMLTADGSLLQDGRRVSDYPAVVQTGMPVQAWIR